MSFQTDAFTRLARARHPLDLLPDDARAGLRDKIQPRDLAAAEVVFDAGHPSPGLFLLRSGVVELVTETGDVVQRYASGETFGERGLVKGEAARLRAVSREPGFAYLIPRETFLELRRRYEPFRRYFEPRVEARAEPDPEQALAASMISDVMTRTLVTIGPDAAVRDAAELISTHNISCLPVVAGGGDDPEGEKPGLVGILTTGDIATRVVARGLSPDAPVSAVMTAGPVTLPPDALGFDALLLFAERGVGHLPVMDNGQLVGLVTSTNFLRRRAVTGQSLLDDIGRKSAFEDLAAITARIPALLEQLVSGGVAAHKIGRIVTRVSDVLTRRLLSLAEERFGPPPLPYLWLACGSQGRSEQTGVSDQDNCLILSDDYDEAAHGAYFEQLAGFVSDGLDAAGYIYCPGDMMATNPKWRQPLKTWRGYFFGWIDRPDPMAQMLATVMFDLRPIAGTESLFAGLQRETLDRAGANSIFRAHMAAHSLSHQPPIGMFGGLTVAKSGEHKDTIDLKHAGVAPIVDLGRLYALRAGVTRVNTRRRLERAIEEKAVSPDGGRDLIDAYDLVQSLRLEHQARLIRAGLKPDNFMDPSTLSRLERSHLRDAFTAIKTMQSAASSSAGPIG